MRLLLDTHGLLWFLAGDERLSSSANAAIEDPLNECFVSAATLWEIAIKLRLGRLTLPRPFTEVFPAELVANSIELIPILPAHLGGVLTLPFHHRDPFDRLLVSQAIAEGF